MNFQNQNNIESELSFEDAMTRLETIIRILDEGNQTLNETLTLYEEGIYLYRHCNQVLEKTEQKITILTKRDGQSYTECNFAGFEGD